MENATTQALLYSPIPLPTDGFFVEIRIPEEGCSSFSLVNVRTFKARSQRNMVFDKRLLVQNCRREIEKFSPSFSERQSDSQHQNERILFGNVSMQGFSGASGYTVWEDMGNLREETNAYDGIRV
tara:strand:+ start:975 stop:1349 length:375 start_codon:yes stop_codon:yes gene_type:complete